MSRYLVTHLEDVLSEHPKRADAETALSEALDAHKDHLFRKAFLEVSDHVDDLFAIVDTTPDLPDEEEIAVVISEETEVSPEKTDEESAIEGA